MKKVFTIMLVALLMVALVACQATSNQTQQQAEPTKSSEATTSAVSESSDMSSPTNSASEALASSNNNANNRDGFQIPPPSKKEGPLKIAVVVVTLNPTSDLLVAGMQEEIDRNGGAEFATFQMLAPTSTTTSLQDQPAIMESVLQQDYDVIILATESEEAMIPYVKQAAEKGIAVFMLNTPSISSNNIYYISSLGAEQSDQSKKIGEWIVNKYKDVEEVNVAVLEGFPGIVNTQRLDGLKSGIAGADNIHIVASQSADWTRAKACDVTENILAANSDIDVIVGLYDEMALGAVSVVKAKGLLDQIAVCGYDNTKDAYQSIKEGELTCTVDSGYKNLGALAIQTVKAYCKDGQDVPLSVNPEHVVYDQDNIDEFDVNNYEYIPQDKVN